MKNYKAIWQVPGSPTLGNVSFTAKSDNDAIKKADKIGCEIGLSKRWRRIQECTGGISRVLIEPKTENSNV